MKKVIEGKLYNTETAERFGHFWNGRSYNDFDCRDETLYRTKKMNYFLHRNNGCRAGGIDIVPMCLAEAMEWMEANEDADAYIKAFGEPEEA